MRFCHVKNPKKHKVRNRQTNRQPAINIQHKNEIKKHTKRGSLRHRKYTDAISHRLHSVYNAQLQENLHMNTND